MILYSLPDFTKNLQLNLTVLEFMRKSPEIFFDDVKIVSMYGSFPGCIMNGGRVVPGEREPYTPARKPSARSLKRG